jgi:GT2 family glycosyltransferase
MAKTDRPCVDHRQPTKVDTALGDAGTVDLTIIVVSFNTRDMTLDCLRSIERETRDISYEIIVVDNSSVDGSAQAISKEFPLINLIASDANLGFAKANNVAADQARGRRILLLNPDTVVLDSAIDRLFAFAEANKTCRVWGGRTLFADGSLNPTSCWGRISLWSLSCFALGLTYFAPKSSIFSPEAYGGWDRDTVRHVDIVTGCFLMIDSDLWKQLGGFDPLFFMYGEEADLCRRASRAGARPIITPSATIIHYGSASDVVSLEKRIKVFRARLTLIDRYFSPFSRGLARRMHLLWPIVRWRAYQLTGWLLSRVDLTEKAEYWHEIYRRRPEWIGGYRVESVKVHDGTLG